jgi:ABC-type branched-subunit amino acid transport system substrate-binding protein
MQFPYKRGIEFAVDEFNANGDLLGRGLRIVYFGTLNISPERGDLAASKLGAKGVASALGGWSGFGENDRSYGKYEFLTL